MYFFQYSVLKKGHGVTAMVGEHMDKMYLYFSTFLATLCTQAHSPVIDPVLFSPLDLCSPRKHLGKACVLYQRVFPHTERAYPNS